VEISGRPVKDDSDKVLYFEVIAEDVSHIRGVEQRLRHVQKMEAIGRLAGGIAHDFNNVLGVIVAYSEMLVEKLHDDEEMFPLVMSITKAVERGGTLTRQLLAFSRQQVLEPQVMSLGEYLGSIKGMLARVIGEDLELKIRTSDTHFHVRVDPTQIEQVIMNLVVNARDAMPKGGSLTIETTNVDLDETYAGRPLAAKPGPHVLLAVSDNGHGMDEATRARLFEPFFTTKSAGKGTGLGLSTVFGIIQQSGGSLEVYSQPDLGTSVKVYLPRIDQPVSVEAQALKCQAARGTETILVVEDDEMVRKLVRETLEREGYRVMDSADPVAARRIADSHKGEIQLLITDVVMPKVSGDELAAQITASRPAIKVLYMSGYTDNAVVNSGILEKEAAFLQKPFTPGALAHKVREVLEKTCKICGAGK
jgi:nitrogen-specific signal transduction histidine kinase/ActR/RegA family two-component response regulator